MLKGLKTRSFNRLKASGKHWIDELPSVLWSIRTTPTKPTCETPFSLVYGAEEIIVYRGSRVIEIVPGAKNRVL